MKSEFMGIRIAMLDALQRYYAADTQALSEADKIEKLQSFIKAACFANNLFTDERKPIVANVWEDFIGHRNPKAVLAFVDAAADTVKALSSDKFFGQTVIKDIAPTMGFQTAMQIAWQSHNYNFETLAKRTTPKLIDYDAGETLSGLLKATEATLRRQGLGGPVKTGETNIAKPIIKAHFKTDHGEVAPSALEGPPASARIKPTVETLWRR